MMLSVCKDIGRNACYTLLFQEAESIFNLVFSLLALIFRFVPAVKAFQSLIVTNCGYTLLLCTFVKAEGKQQDL